MNDTKLCARIANELFRRAQADETADIFDLAQVCGTSLFAVLKALQKLDAEGLVDARRLRLTFSGLALVAAFSRARAPLQPESEAGRPLSRAQHAA
jgi:Mn-dependent DtxR family transcriptional regulator